MSTMTGTGHHGDDSATTTVTGSTSVDRPRELDRSTSRDHEGRRKTWRAAGRDGNHSSSGGSVSHGAQTSSSEDYANAQRLPIGSTIQTYPTHLLEPDDYSAEEEYQRYLQRQFQHRLRTIDRPSTSLLSKLKAPLSRTSASSSSQHSASSNGPSPPSSSSRPPASMSKRPEDHQLVDGFATKDVLTRVASSEPAERVRPRRRDSPTEDGEITQSVMIWQGDHRHGSPSMQATSKGSFAPKMTRKLANLAPVVGHRFPTGSPAMAQSDPSRLKQFSPRLKERPSRLTMASGHIGGQPSTSHGAWKGGDIVLRSDNLLYILDESGALLFTLRANHFRTTDLRPVHETVFGRFNVLGIYALPSSFAGGRPTNSSTSPDATCGPAGTHLGRVVEPIFVCFTSDRTLRLWISLLRACGKPEVFGYEQSWSRGGTHRWYRQLDILISDFRPATSSEPAITLAPIALPHAMSCGQTREPALDKEQQRAGRSAQVLMSGDSSIRVEPTGARGISTSVSGQKTSVHIEPSELSSDRETEEDLEGWTTGPFTSPSCQSQSGSASVPFVRQGQQQRRETDSILAASSPSHSHALSCLVTVDGVTAGRADARTALGPSGEPFWSWSNIPIAIKNLPSSPIVRIELTAFPYGARQAKGQILGRLDVPTFSLTRGESLHFWFPMWTASEMRGDSGLLQRDQAPSIADECIGEIMMKIKFQEYAVLHQRKYSEVEKMLNSSDCARLVKGLTQYLDEDQVIDLLVDVYASLGSVVERLTDFMVAESHTWDVSQPELLFRGNTLLSRALDKFQRTHCREWLDDCLGDVVREICLERLKIEPDMVHRPATGSASGGAVTNDKDLLSSSLPASRDVEQLLDYVKKLWDRIYSKRHGCPDDLRHILSNVRQIVNAKFPWRSNAGSPPGTQAVGLFLFLRLICPAITSPHQYGLMALPPDASVLKTLKQIAKIIWDLTAKRTIIEGKDRDTWSRQIEEFFQQNGSATDDFIVSVSSFEGQTAEKESAAVHGRSEDALQNCLQSRKKPLLRLHRESVTMGPYLLDSALAMAALVSFVARKSPASLLRGGSSSRPESSYRHDETFESQTRTSKCQPLTTSNLVSQFVFVCCEVESRTGYYIDKAGLDPEPVRFESQNIAHSQSMPFSTVATGKRAVTSSRPPLAASTLSRSPASTVARRESTTTISRRRRQTVSAAGGEASDVLAQSELQFQVDPCARISRNASRQRPSIRDPEESFPDSLQIATQRPSQTSQSDLRTRHYRPRASLDSLNPLRRNSALFEQGFEPSHRIDSNNFDLHHPSIHQGSQASACNNSSIAADDASCQNRETSVRESLVLGSRRNRASAGGSGMKWWNIFKP